MTPSDSAEWPLAACARYYREVLSFLTGNLRCPEEAADLAQESFVRLLTLENPGVVRQPRAFLYRIARNLAVDSARKRQVRTRRLMDLMEFEETPSPERQPDEELEENQLYQALQDAIAEMPPRRREVFMLYRYGQLTQADIARRLGISTTMVERHLRKAMAHCRARLEPFL